MTNLIEAAKQQIWDLMHTAYDKAAAAGTLPAGQTLKGAVEIPKDTAYGDYACGCAMAAARDMRMPPRKIAEALVEQIDLNGTYFRECSIAGAGFINFRVSDAWYADLLKGIEADGADYGRVNDGKGERVMVEFVSANPTGPMTIGNARGGVLGDTLATVLDFAGYNVWREFYVNDAGNQIDLFGKSIEARYLQLLYGEENVEFPDNGYHGDDIRELARLIFEKDGDRYKDTEPAERQRIFAEFGIPHNVALMRKHLERYRVNFDQWFFESDLHKNGMVAETVKLLQDGDHTYEKDGALWLRNTDFGAEKDEVLRRSNGFYTYYAVDLAYHRNKFVQRGFDRVINVWGADHHGHAIRFKKSLQDPAMGINPDHLDFLLMQMVHLVRNGETVKVSKRTGKAMSLNDLLDEISVDACRFFFNAKPDTHLEFDLALAVREDSENPVYYAQYAHARICRLIETLESLGSPVPAAADIDVSLLTSNEERELLRQLAALPEQIRLAARDYDPSLVNKYAVELASRFHRFYNAHHIKGEEQNVLNARLKLAATVKNVLAVTLGILGVTAPEKM